MKCFLFRHGHAVDGGPFLLDEARFLTKKGRGAVRAVGRAMRKVGVVPDAILTSPLCRAVQTAELLAQELDFHAVVEVVPWLIPSARAARATEFLQKRESNVLAVGHEPNLSMLAALLLGEPTVPSLRKAQVLCIEATQMLWTMDPDRLVPQTAFP